jgi:hypothetical protein
MLTYMGHQKGKGPDVRSRRLSSIFALLFAGGAVYACSSNSGNNGQAGSPDATTDSPVGSDASPGTGTDASVSDGALQDGEGGPEGASACAVFDASGLDEASVAAGFEQVWQVYRCWGCHQRGSQVVTDAGMGIVLSGNNDGLGDSGMTFPPNLTNDPTGIGCLSDNQVVEAILKGADPEGGMLCPSMPKWGTAMATADGGVRPGTPMDAGTAQEIVDFLRSLPPVMNAVKDTTCATPPEAGADAGEDAGPIEAGSDGAAGVDAGADADSGGD